MMECLPTHFDGGIVADLSRRWKKESESHKNNIKSDFKKKEEKNSTEEFLGDTPEENLKTIDATNQTSRNINFAW